MKSSEQLCWWKPVIGKDEGKNILQVLETGFINDGPVCRNFEIRIAELSNTDYAVAVTSGTTALYLSLLACGVGPGDEVVIPDVTFIATANAVTMTGATPVLVDIETDTLGLDPNLFEQAITSSTKAVIPVHISGRSAKITEIVAIAKRHQLFVVEDAAEALGFSKHNLAIGSQGDLGCFSFSPNKTITTGQGGMIITDNYKLYEKIIMLKDQGRPVRGTGGPDIHQTVGFNFKFTDIQAAMGMAQLDTLPYRLKRLKIAYQIYTSRLMQLELITFPGYAENSTLQWVDVIVENGRDDLCEYLDRNAIETRKFWLPLHRQKPYFDIDDKYTVSTVLCDKALWLPTSLDLSENNIIRVCDAIERWHCEKQKNKEKN